MANIFTIKEKILQIAKYKGFIYEGFCEKIGMTYGNFKGKAKKTPINSETLANIFTIIPELNLEWLITGTGEMLKKSEVAAGIGADGPGDGAVECVDCKQKDEKIAALQAQLEEAKVREERLFDTIAHLQSMYNYPVQNKKVG